MDYVKSIFNYTRRQTPEVAIGSLKMGSSYPIRIQSMANTNTNDTEACVNQCKKIIDAGADLVRFTTQGLREAENLAAVRAELHRQNRFAPLVADVHFNPNVADAAAKTVEKVRINPGNYVDSIHTFKHVEYTDREYALEVEKIHNRLLPFLDICRKNHTAIRIGVNHGSLSDRIMSRFGDTPQGMVESCMEFLRICRATDFNNVVVSIKSSNTVAMVQTVRLLAATMQKENMPFPLHIGVTEAGDGEDGRIKSAVGIGTLLLDGIGDTIRVSLTENPENEVPVAKKLVTLALERMQEPTLKATTAKTFSAYEYKRRKTTSVLNVGGTHTPIVIGDASQSNAADLSGADFVYTGKNNAEMEVPTIVDAQFHMLGKNSFPLFDSTELIPDSMRTESIFFVKVGYSQLTDATIDFLRRNKNGVIWHELDTIAESRAFFHTLTEKACANPVIIAYRRNEPDNEKYQLAASMFAGSFFLDGFGDGLMLQNTCGKTEGTLSTAFGILQATRTRMSKTEFIACPGCGRTMFDLQTTLARVKSATSHLKNLKIAVMGCIVNGTGEMADADYGYVGAGKGKISLYKQKECIEKNIPEEEAIARLTAQIKANGDWIEKK